MNDLSLNEGKLLSAFARHCANNRIDYFLIEDALVAAVVYGRLYEECLPIRIGIIRQEFVKLAKGTYPFSSRPSQKLGDGLLLKYSYEDSTPCYRVVFAGCENGAQGESPFLCLRVYDAFPEDYDLMRWQHFEMRVFSRVRQRVSPCLQGIIDRKIDKIARRYDNRFSFSRWQDALSRSQWTVSRAALETTDTLPLEGLEIRIPSDTSHWIIRDAAIEKSRSIHIQHDLMTIALEIDRICRKHEIGYFLCAGSLLGAVRHQGFIPWDDDMDIGMLRADYERFIDIAKVELSHEFFLQTRVNDPAIPYLYVKIQMEGTEAVTRYTQWRNQHKGIAIDIFPFDESPVGSVTFAAHYSRARKLIAKHKHIAKNQTPVARPKRAPKNISEVLGKTIMTVKGCFYWHRSLRRSQEAYEAHVTKYNKEGACGYVASYVNYLTYIRLDDLFPLKNAPFEGAIMLVPNNPDALLKMQYGDNYLKEPEPHEQRGHPLVRWLTSDGCQGTCDS